MGCGQSSDTDNSNSTKSTKIIPNKSTPSNDNNNTFNGSKGGFSQRMFRNKNKTNSKTKEIKHAGDFAVILKNGSFIVIEAGIAIGKFGEYHVGDLIQIKMAELRNVLRRLFVDFDIDGDGTIDSEEVHLLLKSILSGSELAIQPFTREEGKSVLRALDKDKNGTVDEDEWVDWMLSGLCENVLEREQAITDLDINGKQDLGTKLAALLDTVENIFLSGVYVEYSINDEIRYVSERVNRNEWNNCGIFSIMKGARDLSASIQWVSSAKSTKSSKPRPIRWIELEGIETKNTWLIRNIKEEEKEDQRSAARSANESIKSILDTTKTGISFVAGIPSNNGEGTIMCGMNSFEQIPLKDIFIPDV